MNQLQITEETIKKEYANGDEATRRLLERLCPSLVVQADFSEILSFEAACKVEGLDPEKCLPIIPEESRCFAAATIAHHQRLIIAKAMRGTWVPDYDNPKKKKWLAVFCVVPSGFGFSDTYYDYSRTVTNVGSRLEFPTIEMATHFGKNFTEIHRAALTQ